MSWIRSLLLGSEWTGTSVWGILASIPDADVFMLPPGRHRDGIPASDILARLRAERAQASGGRHRRLSLVAA